MKLWDVALRQERLTLEAGRFLAIAPDGHTLATGGAGAIQLRRAATSKEALAVKSELNADDPASPVARNNAGDRLRTEGEREAAELAYRGALARLEKLAEVFPEDPRYTEEMIRSHFGLTLLYGSDEWSQQTQETFGKAVALCEELVRRFPGKPEYRIRVTRHFLSLGRMLMDDDRPDRAEEIYRKAIEVAPEDANAWNEVSLFYSSRDLEDKAGEHYSRAIELDPDSEAGFWHDRVVFWNNRAIANCRSDHWAGAVDDFAESIRIEPDQEVVHYWHALACLGAGEHEAYRSACARMVQQFAGNETASVGQWVAWTCALAPEAVSDLAEAVKAAGHAVSKQPDADRHLNTLGAILYRAGRYEEAVQWMNEIAKQGPARGLSSPAYTWFFLAMAHQQLGHPEEGQTWLREAISRAEEEIRDDTEVAWNRRLTLDLLRAEAEALLAGPQVDAEPSDEGSPQPSGEVRLSLSGPYQWVLHCRRARRFAAEENWTEAASAFSKATKLRPDDCELWRESAQAHVESEQWGKAVEDYGQVIKLRPDDAEAWRQRAEAYLELKQWDQAITDYDQGIKLNPDDAQTYVDRSKAHRRKGDQAKAIDDCTAALRINPKHVGAFHNRAIAHRLSGHYNEALEDTNAGLLVKPDHRLLLHERALVFGHLGAHDKAIADYSEAIRIAPEDAGLHRARSEAYLALGRYDEALADWERYVELGRDDAVAALIRAQMLLMADRTEDYRQACQEILDRFGQSERPAACCHAARACLLAPKAVPDPMVPVELATRAVSRDPRGWTLYTLGMAHLRAGQRDEAAQRFQESLDAHPEWGAMFLNWLGLALVHHERGETEEARQWLGKAIESMEQHPAPATQGRIEGQLLRREVQQLLGEPEQKKKDAESQKEE